jgi:hypothetical protein
VVEVPSQLNCQVRRFGVLSRGAPNLWYSLHQAFQEGIEYENSLSSHVLSVSSTLPDD